MESYLSSFGASPTPAEAESHEVFKRSSSTRKVKRTKKVSTTTEASVDVKIPTKPLNNGKNFTVSPRHIVKFELDDAKYSEEYEKLKKSRKLRVKRSSDFEGKANGTRRTEKFVTKETFVQPRELFKFSFLDAVTKSPEASEVKETSEKKTKREVSADSTANDSKKIHVSHPMRGYRSTKHVSYDDISAKLQKMIDSALYDAVQKGKASDGDYLRFFYGDKIIKVPVAMSKYVATKSKETPPHGKKVVEEQKAETPKLLGTKNAYFPVKTASIKYDQPIFLPTTTTEKAESYVNFNTPIVVEPDVPEIKYEPYKKSVYYYANDATYYGKNSMSSPGPVLFDEPTTPSSIDTSEPLHYKNFIYHPPTKLNIKEEIPITEHVNESFDYIPSAPEHHSYPTIPTPTSYVEYAGNHADSHDHSKNYEFGYVLRHTFKR